MHGTDIKTMKELFPLFQALVLLSALMNILPVKAATLTLKPIGEPRLLKAPVFGASTTAFYERLLDDPVKIAALQTMAMGLDRFPGGSDANFYNWRTGLIEIQAHSDSSSYVQFWAKAAANIARGKPEGVTFEQYASFSRK